MTAADGMMLWTGDYLADTFHLTLSQHGAYLLILMAMWRNGGYLPLDETRIANLVRLPKNKWRQIAQPVMDLMTVEGDRFTQKRLLSNLKSTLERIEKNRLSGSAGGQAKSLNDKKRALANATISLQQKASVDLATKTQTKNRKNTDFRSVADATRPDPMFEKLWAIYPKREGINPKKPARAKYLKLVRDGADPDQIIAGVKHYAELEHKNIGTKFIKTTSAWLNQWSPEDDAPSPIATRAKSTKLMVKVGDNPQWKAWEKYFRTTRGVGAPQTDLRWPDRDSPLVRGWLFDSEYPPGYVRAA
jgi:uncharacterized protein YdaU (DUF1376 family)